MKKERKEKKEEERKGRRPNNKSSKSRASPWWRNYKTLLKDTRYYRRLK